MSDPSPETPASLTEPMSVAAADTAVSAGGAWPASDPALPADPVTPAVVAVVVASGSARAPASATVDAASEASEATLSAEDVSAEDASAQDASSGAASSDSSDVGGEAIEAGDLLEQTLDSLLGQDYENLSILVVGYGAGAAELAERVADVAPDAYFHHSRALGFAAAANQALELVTGGSFLLFCGTDVVLEPSCVRHLVEEVYRSNAGIVTPKFVQYRDPRRIDAIGLGVDQFAVTGDLIEEGDFDQEQYDHVTDVFVAPRGVQLVRADLFRALDGFDGAMDSDEDVDLCWRARLVGARVLAVPAAVVRRRRRLTPPGPVERRHTERHRVRTLLTTLSPLSLLWTLPLALLQLLLAGVYGLFAGRRHQLGDVFDTIIWNAGRLGETRQRRRRLQAERQVSDREVRALQFGGSARLTGFFRNQVSAGDRVVDFAATVRGQFSGDESARYRDATIVGTIIFGLLLIGSRELITDGVTPVGQFLDVPRLGVLWGEWWGGWRDSGVGGPGNPSTAFGMLAALRVVLFWGDGLPMLLLTMVPLLSGPVGMWRLVRPIGSVRAAATGTAAYAANPLLLAIVTAGRWDALVLWGATPWLVCSLLRLQAVDPYRATPENDLPRRDLPTRLLRVGFLVAVTATFVPAVVPVAVVVVVALAAGSMLLGRLDGLRALLAALPVVVVVPAALHGPFTVDVIRRFRWSWLVGPPSPETSFDSLADLIRFAPGVGGIRLLALGLLIAAAVPLVIGRGRRFELGTVGWSLATVAWLLAWIGRRDWLEVPLPTAEIFLVLAATGIALAAGVGTAAVEEDLASSKYGWRQVFAFGGTVVLLVSAGLLLLQSSVSGRWGLPAQSHTESVALAAERFEGPARVLWLGQPSVLPIEPLETDAGISYAVSGERADARGRWLPGAYGFDERVGLALDLAATSETSRLGALLAPFGIDLIVVVPTVAPAPYVGTPVDPGGGIVSALSAQLDLARVPGMPDLVVYRNNSSLGPVAAVEQGSLPASGDPITVLNTDLTAGTRVVAEAAPGHWQGPAGEQVLETGEVLVAVPAEGWVSTTAALPPRQAFDGLLVARLDADGRFDVRHETPVGRRLALLGQVALVAVGVVAAQSRLRELDEVDA